MKFYKKLIQQLYMFDFCKYCSYDNVPEKEIEYYNNKLHNKFNIKKEIFDNYIEKLYKIDNNVNTYYGDGNNMTIVFDKYVMKISKNIEEYYIMENIKNKKLENFINITNIFIDIESGTFIYFIKKDNIIINDSFIKDEVLLKFIVDLNKNIEFLENFGYYHTDISLSNIVYSIKDYDKPLSYDNIIFKLIGYCNLRNIEKKYEHKFRKSIKKLLNLT